MATKAVGTVNKPKEVKTALKEKKTATMGDKTAQDEAQVMTFEDFAKSGLIKNYNKMTPEEKARIKNAYFTGFGYAMGLRHANLQSLTN